jgi:hypothetical protein
MLSLRLSRRALKTAIRALMREDNITAATYFMLAARLQVSVVS